MATVMGTTTLAEPAYEDDGYTRSVQDVGALHETADGGMTYDYIGAKYRFRLKWKAITEAEKTAILTEYAVKTAQVFSPPDAATTYTVLVSPNSWSETYIVDGGAIRRYSCELELVETAV